GEQGKIYKYNQNVIGIQNDQQNPSEFSLEQNYPNPFNPSTHFNFGIAVSGFVRLAVYNVLGKEVAVIVNKQLQPGKYEVEWNAADYPSGVYYYRLEVVNEGDAAPTFTETGKMVLLK
ncbi:MAG: T9SS type A sorting domain-containing protein, partial [Ignavibacteria bacterium]|nr:T9SS type A sorting domain-containing protein [Ignavibacteria bacterium]